MGVGLANLEYRTALFPLTRPPKLHPPHTWPPLGATSNPPGTRAGVAGGGSLLLPDGFPVAWAPGKLCGRHHDVKDSRRQSPPSQSLTNLQPVEWWSGPRKTMAFATALACVCACAHTLLFLALPFPHSCHAPWQNLSCHSSLRDRPSTHMRKTNLCRERQTVAPSSQIQEPREGK